MGTGGLGNYNPDLDGFVSDNSPSATQLAGVMDVVEGKSNGYLRDLHDGHLHLWCESGAYGVAWASISSNLPATPAGGRAVIRINTDASNEMRLYVYNHETLTWKYVALA